MQPSVKDEQAPKSCKAAKAQAAWQASYLTLCRHSGISQLDKKLQALQNGFDDVDFRDVRCLVQERRLPLDAQSRVEGWLRDCRTMEDRAKGCRANHTLYNSIVQDCETELYRIRNRLLTKTNRFELIPHRLAKLRRWAGQEDENATVLHAYASSDIRQAKTVYEVQPQKVDLDKHRIDTSWRLSLERLREALETLGDTDQETGSDSKYDNSDNNQSEPSRRHTWSGEIDRARREEEQETHRLVLAMSYKWPVNMRRAKIQYRRAMEKQEWERDEVALVRHSWTF
ncbi:hypothetical protein ColTof4_03341 [Colletotrichum tofieldiae]|uniref:Uncharacterized protein n=1 Tax=Colletotrichum tofieldiae TaxID=708197 RepID=A0A161WKB0_9PEZI|nr:hypothetical protein CT0861_05970 [Colletotrichum tofieldiae]GKT65904.1 hypothetical protein ColTof3_13243 [Colletotrichum tofieldiae]GKT70918.1 hypothetical protein ColTof4_03341 [Colletotrichum tofieldiae]GKT94180.1 hypothetical protein Ct61P_12030 [Colletotrichum tofieldiae]